jgi:hypothetical protein
MNQQPLHPKTAKKLIESMEKGLPVHFSDQAMMILKAVGKIERDDVTFKDAESEQAVIDVLALTSLLITVICRFDDVEDLEA